MPRQPRHEKAANLALQGGGSHGAFTWGVLDRLFEDDRLWIEAISGASAGAMTAVVVAQGFHDGGAEGARAALERFWRRVSEAAVASPIRRSPLDVLLGTWNLDLSPGFQMVDLLSRLASPYLLNPLELNPLRDLVGDLVDFGKVRACHDLDLHISATNVETGRVRVFERQEITLDVVMASACLPFLYHAVEIDGRHYWDGGFMGNPVLFPFFDHSRADDVIIVQINPVVRPGVPKKAQEIANRVNEITFNSSLLKELRAIDFVRRLIEQGRLEAGEYRAIHVHVIEARKKMRPLGASSKLNAEWPFLRHLFGIGRDAADRWLARNYDAIGRRSTVNLRQMFEGDRPRPAPAEKPERQSGPRGL